MCHIIYKPTLKMQRVRDVLLQSTTEITKETYTACHQASISLYFMKIYDKGQKGKQY